MKLKWIQFVIYLIFAIQSSAQMSGTVYSDPMLNYYTGVDTSYQYFDEIKDSLSEVNTLRKLFKFSPEQFYGSYQRVGLFENHTMMPDLDFVNYIGWAGMGNFFHTGKVNFKLDGDTATSFFYKNDFAQDTNIAFLIIPGTGYHESTSIADLNPGDYHNSVCLIAQKCLNYGEVYTYVRPNEDFISLWASVTPTSRKKLSYPQMKMKTNLMNRNWAANGYIQIIALTKYLQSKYKKVVVLGLSAGSWGAFFTSLQTEPDGTNAASGYSINFNMLNYPTGPQQFEFDGLFTNHPIDSIRKTIKNQSTQYLFSYGANDNVTYMAEENTIHTTQNYFNTPDTLRNASFFYNFTTHRFPCEALDTFFLRIKRMPKAEWSVQNTCLSDSSVLKVSFIGTPPFSFDLYRNDTLYSSLTSNVDSMFLNLTQEGQYSIRNLLDSNQILGFKAKDYFYIKQTKLTLAPITQQYLCGTDSTEILLDCTGTPMYHLVYQLNGNAANDTITFTSDNYIPKLANGDYLLQTLIDSNDCRLEINQNLSIHNEKLSDSLSSPYFNCDSNSAMIHIELKGNNPWVISYSRNGQLLQLQTTDSIFDHYFENGVYQFFQITDATNCVVPLNQYHVFDFDTLDIQFSQPVYQCASNLTLLTIQLQGNPPYFIDYTLNGTAQQVSTSDSQLDLMLADGNYTFNQIFDATNCSILLNETFNITNTPISLTWTQPTYHCDSQRTLISMNATGNGPVYLNYLFNNTPQQLLLQSGNTDYFFDNGSYVFLNVTDATFCSQTINQSYLFDYDTIGSSIITPYYDCQVKQVAVPLSFVGNAPFSFKYVQDGMLQTYTTNNSQSTLYLNNDNYIFDSLTDATGCGLSINQSHVFDYDTLNIVTSVPIYDCDSHQVKIQYIVQGNAPIVIDYKLNGTPQQHLVTTGSYEFYYTNGSYEFLQASDATGCIQPLNLVYNFNYDTLSFQVNAPVYVCDTHLTNIHIDLQGNAPWTIQYSQNTNMLQEISLTNSLDLYLVNDTYQLLSLEDATGCMLPMGQNFTINFDTLDVNLSVPVYDCDSNQTKIEFECQGNGPWTINYTENMQGQQFVSTVPNFSIYLNNGNYFFTKIVDATNCEKLIGQGYTFNYAPINAMVTSQHYNCDSNQYQIDFNFAGNSPWTLQYQQGATLFTKTFYTPNSSLYLPNGNWMVQQVTDATGCVKLLTLPFSLNFTPVNSIINSQSYQCDSNKLKIDFTFSGNAPWILHYIRTGITPVNYYVTVNSPQYSLLLPNGTYLIVSVTDSNQCQTIINYSTVNNFTPLNIQKISSQYNCDSNKLQVNYQFYGDGPWVLKYKNLASGQIISQISSQSMSSLFLMNGVYQVQSITDAKCTKLLNDTIWVNFPKLITSITPTAVACDSNKTVLQVITTSGAKPYTLYYYENNLPRMISYSQDTLTLYLTNGLYFIDYLADSLGCQKSFNQTITAEYYPFQFLNYTTSYLCEQDSTLVHFDISHVNRLNLLYSKNGGLQDTLVLNGSNSFVFSNGDYQWIALSDSLGCVDSLNLITVIDNHPIGIDSLQVETLCPERMYQYGAKLYGKAPWTLNYNYQNKPDYYSTSDSSLHWIVPSGEYYLLNLVDVNQCELNLNRTDSLIEFSFANPAIQKNGNYLETINMPYRYYWYRNQQLIDSVSGYRIPIAGSGVYQVSLADFTGCIYTSDTLNLDYPGHITVYPNPASNMTSILVNEAFGEYWSYSMHDIAGNVVLMGNSNAALKEIDVRNLSSGIYSLMIQYQGASHEKYVIRFVRY